MEINKVDWVKTVGRKADLQKAIQFSCYGGGGFGKFFQIKDLYYQLYYFDGRTTNIYFSEKEYSHFLSNVMDRLDDISFVKIAGKEIINVCNKSISNAKKLLKDANSNNLLEIFKKYDDIWNGFYPIAWTFFFIGGFESKIENKLVKLGFDDEKIKEIMTIASKPHKLTPVLESELEILKLAKTNSKISKEIAKKLSKKYGWMSVYNTEDSERGYEYYLEEANKIKTSGINLNEKVKQIENDLDNNELKFKEIIKEIKDDLLIEQLKLFHFSGYLRDKREEARDVLTILEKPIYRLIAKNLGFNESMIVYLTNDEIINALSGKANVLELEILSRNRIKEYIFYVENNKFFMIDDQEKIKEISKLFEVKQQISEIRGQIAYKQKERIRGIVRVVLSNKELSKVNDGDILVSTMTKPDFLAVMKKAAAFITDEGGITCHAAIVAREMKKACIIGTKNATKILKDGDLVEVDAENGIVKILERGK